VSRARSRPSSRSRRLSSWEQAMRRSAATLMPARPAALCMLRWRRPQLQRLCSHKLHLPCPPRAHARYGRIGDQPLPDGGTNGRHRSTANPMSRWPHASLDSSGHPAPCQLSPRRRVPARPPENSALNSATCVGVRTSAPTNQLRSCGPSQPSQGPSGLLRRGGRPASAASSPAGCRAGAACR
jgi:hypothetical protein